MPTLVPKSELLVALVANSEKNNLNQAFAQVCGDRWANVFTDVALSYADSEEATEGTHKLFELHVRPDTALAIKNHSSCANIDFVDSVEQALSGFFIVETEDANG